MTSTCYADDRARRVVKFVFTDRGLWVLFFCHCALTLPALLGFANSGRNFDETAYHMPTIRAIISTWPQLDMNVSSFSAVAPGYHYLLATIGRVVGDDLRTLRFFNCGFSFLLPLLLYWHFRARVWSTEACLLVLPVVTSNFYIKSACWILPDNAALVVTTLALIGLVNLAPRECPGGGLGLIATLATAFRQTNVWLVGPYTLRSIWWFFSSPKSSPHLPVKQRGAALLLSLTAGALLPLCVLATLYLAWGGLVPAQWRGKGGSPGFSLAAVVYSLSLLGFFGSFYIVGFAPQMAAFSRGKILAFSATFGLVIGLVTPTFPSVEAGRWGGYLWLLAQRLPAIADRSMFLMLMAAFGMLVVTLITLQLLHERGFTMSFTWVISLGAWACSMTASRQIFQRYYEPTLLIFLALAASYLGTQSQCKMPWSTVRRLALVALTCFQISVTLFTIYAR